MEEFKDLLLQKGMSSEDADEVIAEMNSSENSSPLALLKAEMDGGSEMDTLFKAKGEGKETSEDDDDDYDEEYMKKYMKKYMKANKEEASDAAEEAGLFGKEMKKAVEDFDFDAEGAVVEMADLQPVLEALVPAIETMAKAIQAQNERIEVIADQNKEGYSLMHKAAAVTAETAETISGIGSLPKGRKGVTTLDMSKAKTAIKSNPKEVLVTLSKALATGDMKAGDIGSKFQSAGCRIEALSPGEQTYVKDLIDKEAN